jgi:DNA-3-methyladenine glycosylase II
MLNEISSELKPVPPFRLDLTVWVLRRERSNILDRWDGSNYRRTIAVENKGAEITVFQSGTIDQPLLQVRVTGEDEQHRLQLMATQTLERTLGLQINLDDFYRFFAEDQRFGPLVNRFRGVKPPRFPSIFEAALNGISCQQISLIACMSLMDHLVENYGRQVSGLADSGHAFPVPKDLAGLTIEDLRKLGYSRNKGSAIIRLATAIKNRLDLESLSGMSDAEALSYLDAMPGIGRWTAEYILLRGSGRTHISPGDDVGARRRLTNLLGLAQIPDYESANSLLANSKPYSGLLYFHLLLLHLEEKGYLR